VVEPIRQGDIPGVQLRCRRTLPGDLETVWSCWTDASLLRRWLADQLEVQSAGQTMLAEWGPADGEAARVRFEAIGQQWPVRLVFDLLEMDAGWPVATRLTVELERRDDGSEISVLQQGFAHLPLSECLTIWERYRRCWRAALERLARLLATEI
jgi:uncharacterized protein YndB with AHSA1/START domain